MWKNLEVNKNNIEYRTIKAILIKMPNKSEFKGYSFWHPAKLVREGRQVNLVNMAYTDEFVFNLKKYGQGRYNRKEVIDSVDITAEQMEECFEIVNNELEESYLKVTEPEKIDVKFGVNKDLLNN